MAVDKLVDSTQLDTDLTSVANAIRTKGGTSAQLAFPSGFVSAIDAIPTGGGEPKDDYCNPMGTWYSELPDLSKLDRTGQVVYFVVDTSRAETTTYGSFGIRPVPGGTMERGHISSNGTFVVDETIQIASAEYWLQALNKNGERFWVYRFTSESNITTIQANYPTNVQSYSPLVEVYGNLPYATSFTVANSLETIIVIDLKINVFPSGTNKAFKVILDGTFKLVANAFYMNKVITELDMTKWNINANDTFSGFAFTTQRLRKIIFGTHNTSSVTTIANMLNGATSLNHIDISGLNLSGVTTTTSAFGSSNCDGVTDIDGWTPIYVSYALDRWRNLTHDSLMKVINSLPTVQTSQTLTLGSVNLGRLSSEEIAIATAKGWTVA